MKKIVMIGGAGTVGNIIHKGLNEIYDIVIMDKESPKEQKCKYIKVDATNYNDLLDKIPKDTDCLINLLKMDTNASIEGIEMFDQMTEVFFKATYYILMVAKKYNIPKSIFASSNHVTDIYEEEGESILGRQINVNDYPYMNGLYGVLKLASEQLGFIFSHNSNLSVVNIRIGSIPSNINNEVIKKGNNRLRKTVLTNNDVIELFKATIESTIKYGTFYGVSDNPGKPWDTSNAKEQLGFISVQNINDILYKR